MDRTVLGQEPLAIERATVEVRQAGCELVLTLAFRPGEPTIVLVVDDIDEVRQLFRRHLFGAAPRVLNSSISPEKTTWPPCRIVTDEQSSSISSMS